MEWNGLKMILEIEYYKGNTLLYGKSASFAELKKQLETTEFLCDTDNFIDMLCRSYSYTVIEEDVLPDYVYDRDIEKIYRRR